MDVFEGGRLIKIQIGIGYPQFPLPTGLRKANAIISIPLDTPDEPWVAKMKNVTVGEKVEAGSALNPLGPIKVPIGLPSLIHGGKCRRNSDLCLARRMRGTDDPTGTRLCQDAGPTCERT